MKIIDFHTHPFIDKRTNICSHKNYIDFDPDTQVEFLKSIGISQICGSVLTTPYTKENTTFANIKERNDIMLELKKAMGDFYIPGFHIHPSFVKESLEEVERMHKLGINLIGELVPYSDGWDSYCSKEFYEIIDLANQYDMVLSIHTCLFETMDKLVKDFKNLKVVGAHPSEGVQLESHIERLKNNENYMIDISGGGISRHGTLRRLIDVAGVERVLFGSDYAVCNPAAFVGGVMLDKLVTDNEKEYIFHKNAERILKL